MEWGAALSGFGGLVLNDYLFSESEAELVAGHSQRYDFKFKLNINLFIGAGITPSQASLKIFKIYNLFDYYNQFLEFVLVFDIVIFS